MTLQAHDVVTVLDGPYAGLSGIVLLDGRIWCNGFEPFTAAAERARPAPFWTRGYDGEIGQKIAVELERARACKRLGGSRHVIPYEDQHERRARCMSCGEQMELWL